MCLHCTPKYCEGELNWYFAGKREITKVSLKKHKFLVFCRLEKRNFNLIPPLVCVSSPACNVNRHLHNCSWCHSRKFSEASPFPSLAVNFIFLKPPPLLSLYSNSNFSFILNFSLTFLWLYLIPKNHTKNSLKEFSLHSYQVYVA